MKIGRERDAFVVVITFGSATLHRLQPVLVVKRTNCECVQRARLSQSLHLLFIASVVVVVVVFYATDREHVSTSVPLQLLFFNVFFCDGHFLCGIWAFFTPPKSSRKTVSLEFTYSQNEQIHNRKTHKKASSDVLSRLRLRRCRTYIYILR
jgi:hypothetical protein